jgi:hypothetical protein
MELRLGKSGAGWPGGAGWRLAVRGEIEALML